LLREGQATFTKTNDNNNDYDHDIDNDNDNVKKKLFMYNDEEKTEVVTRLRADRWMGRWTDNPSHAAKTHLNKAEKMTSCQPDGRIDGPTERPTDKRKDQRF